jgi:hypothetical protein
MQIYVSTLRSRISYILAATCKKWCMQHSFSILLLAINEGLIVFSPLHYFSHLNASTPIAMGRRE